MFTCRACLRRTFEIPSSRHSLPKNPSASRHDLPPFRATVKPSPPSRRYATVAAHTPSADTANPAVTQSPVEFHDGKAPVLGRSAAWAARKELEYLRDPLHIANRVRQALSKNNYELASLITREASKDNNLTVSWNYLIDYQLQNGRIHSALKLYNEMKKRAQQPNAQTFTIIFRGCAKSEHPKLAVNEAVKLYQNMLSVGRIKPNTIHLNAVLQVCAKVGDLDSMFSILGSSDDPLRSPNNLTYTTIFNALRMKVDRSGVFGGLEDKKTQKERQDTVVRAKAIWEEVISRWRSGSLIIDEELVCAMGRILLMGEYTDIDAIESLIEQTMMIPRADNKGLSERKGTESTALTVPQSTIKAPGAPAITHAIPGNNSLSMILEGLEKTRRTTKAIKYWNVFTLHHNVIPDAENWIRALRVFVRGKNSGRAAVALQKMPSDMITYKHIRLAMKACLRDNLNKLALDNATAILKTVGQTPSTPDVQWLRTYLQVAHASKRSFDNEARHDYTGAMNAWAKSLATALEHLFGAYQAAAKQMAVDAPNTKERLQNSKAELVALARRMCAAYDILMSQHAASLTAAQLTKMRLRHAGLTRLITNHFKTEHRHFNEQAGGEENVEDNKSKQQAATTSPFRRKPLYTGGNENSLRSRLKDFAGDITKGNIPGFKKTKMPCTPSPWQNLGSNDDLLCLASADSRDVEAAENLSRTNDNWHHYQHTTYQEEKFRINDSSRHPVKWLDRVLETSYATRNPISPKICVSKAAMELHYKSKTCIFVEFPRNRQLPEPLRCYPGFKAALEDICDRFGYFYAPFAAYNAHTRTITLYVMGASRPENKFIDEDTALFDLWRARSAWVQSTPTCATSTDEVNGASRDTSEDLTESSDRSQADSEETWATEFEDEKLEELEYSDKSESEGSLSSSFSVDDSDDEDDAADEDLASRLNFMG
ncbi:hypothetical protein GQX73_g2968 [Xylaria multiplex]|uniref:Pentacotripeptide-repeat region of PRORP domain-containing protein n=1 Tax=Xylaria multiplex TaxID=323545 RepID=A0A7C8MPS4_9PEZI|nr:hypothetical protein GQX73_g2968 [Xylaria multiplex]